MVVNDFDIKRMTILPSKAQPPLIVDADAVLARTVPAKGFEAVPGRNAQIIERRRGGQHRQFPASGSLNGTKPPHESILGQLLGITTAKAADHKARAYTVFRNRSTF